MISGSKGQKSIRACTIRSLKLESAKHEKNETLNFVSERRDIQGLFSGGGSDGGRKNEKYDIFEGTGSECRTAEGT